MGVFLKAAYEVLQAAQTPLSAPEITKVALERKLIPPSGKTPSQTMKSKLSTNILKQGDRSVFMRAAKGKFALRGWKTAYPEHIADRYQKALFDEEILVFPAVSLRRYIPGVGLYSGEVGKPPCYRMQSYAEADGGGRLLGHSTSVGFHHLPPRSLPDLQTHQALAGEQTSRRIFHRFWWPPPVLAIWRPY